LSAKVQEMMKKCALPKGINIILITQKTTQKISKLVGI